MTVSASAAFLFAASRAALAAETPPCAAGCALACRGTRLGAVARFINGGTDSRIHPSNRIRRFIDVGNLHAVFSTGSRQLRPRHRPTPWPSRREPCTPRMSFPLIERLLHIYSQPARLRISCLSEPPTLSHGHKAAPLGQAEPSRQSVPRGRAWFFFRQLALYGYMNFLMSRMASSTTSTLPARTCSTTHVSMWSCKTISAMRCGRLRRRKLHEHISAVAIVGNHVFHAIELANRAV